MKLRADRWRQNPAKDAERAAQLAPYVTAIAALDDGDGRHALRWLMEEFRVSVFAQELGTAEPVSAVKLDRAFAAVAPARRSARPAGAPQPQAASHTPPRPIVAAPLSSKKPTPLKTLGALDKLFPR
jgi:ATP-dependent helicase HrpA